MGGLFLKWGGVGSQPLYKLCFSGDNIANLYNIANTFNNHLASMVKTTKKKNSHKHVSDLRIRVIV